MGLNEIRSEFLKFFESKDHHVEASFSLVPKEDKSLLLINAGMAPLKKYFTGAEKPPKPRMATCQKCIRTGDIENVGHTARHATFFEMLGNFSFGDYFKSKSIAWGWEFLTEVLGIPEDKLWASVYEEDDEAYAIWRDEIKIPEDRIVRLGKEDNFWEIGTGPCGPCSEIYFDRGETYSCGDPDHKPGCECDQFLEVWNHVFTQFNKNEDGTYTPLANKNIDTGMGLERIAAVMQSVDSIFEVDTIRKVLDKVVQISGKEYGALHKDDVSIRIITDHVRSVTFMVADGILPNNEGRGYVMRRLLRRAARHGKLLGIDRLFLRDIVETVIAQSAEAYPNLSEQREFILQVISLEEERFYQTIDQGMAILEEMVGNTAEGGILAGDDAFKLYDTYGFPLDLTREILSERGMSVDESGFEEAMEAQRNRARQAREEAGELGWDEGIGRFLVSVSATRFTGYETLSDEGKLVAMFKDGQPTEMAGEGESVQIVTDSTPFYAESGGQVGDVGTIHASGGIVSVKRCHKTPSGVYIHEGMVNSGSLRVGETLKLVVDSRVRFDTARHHTATHLLHQALRDVLGTHVQQAGSLVENQRLRFDFSHFHAMTAEEIAEVEQRVNEEIFKAHRVSTVVASLDEARAMGATALFSEKYADTVRVVKVGDYSMELCGGTHVGNAGEIGLFKLVSESGVAAGVRRIEAVTGRAALKYFHKVEETLDEVVGLLKSSREDLASRTRHLVEENRNLGREIDRLKTRNASAGLDEILSGAETIDGVTILRHGFDQLDLGTVRTLGDKLKDRLDEYLIVLGARQDDKVIFVSMASDGAIQRGLHAGNVVREVAKLTGGNGGGRPNMAQAGGKDPEKMESALNRVVEIAKNMLK